MSVPTSWAATCSGPIGAPGTRPGPVGGATIHRFTPRFVLTHHPRAPLAMKGGTTFTFVTDGIEAALDQAEPRPGT